MAGVKDGSSSKNIAVTPLPWSKVLVVCSVIFANTFGSLVIFPILPFMVHDFFPDTPRDQLGRASGFLASSFHLGDMAGAYMWGKISDTHGRRRTMLAGLMGTFVSITLFGFSPNYAWAVSMRFMWGLLNGNIGVAKSYLSEVCNDSNMAKGFSMIGMSVGFGRMIAPISGAFLARPAVQFPGMFKDTVFDTFPYLPPCLLGALVCIGSFVSAYKNMEETLVMKSKSSNEELSQGRSILESIRSCIPFINKNKYRRVNTEDSDASMTDEDFDEPEVQARNASWRLLKNKDIFLSSSLYFVLAMVSIINAEIFPLWVLNGKEHGGFGFKQTQIGEVILMSAPFQIASQAFIFPWLSNKMGYKLLMQVACVVLLVTVNITPLLSAMGPDAVVSFQNVSVLELSCQNATGADAFGTMTPRPFTTGGSFQVECVNVTRYELQEVSTPGSLALNAWVVLVLNFALNQMWQVMALTAVMALINNSCFPSVRGTVNGIAQTMASAARAIGPTLGGFLYAWSQSNGLGWPFDLRFLWNVLTLFLLLAILETSLLPLSINVKKVAPPPRVPTESEEPEGVEETKV